MRQCPYPHGCLSPCRANRTFRRQIQRPGRRDNRMVCSQQRPHHQGSRPRSHRLRLPRQHPPQCPWSAQYGKSSQKIFKTIALCSQALHGRPARGHRAAPIRGRGFTLCKTAPMINNQQSIIWCIKSDVYPKLSASYHKDLQYGCK